MEHEIFEQVSLLTVGVSLALLGVIGTVGFVVSLLQAATQIQDQTILFVPKFLALVATLSLCSGYLGGEFSQLFDNCLRALARVSP